MFEIGDLIIYGSTGVCEIQGIKTLDIPGVNKKQLYYVIKPVNQTCTISAPVDSQKVFMRPIISKDEALRLIDSIPSIEAEAFHSRALRELTEHYSNILNTHNCEDLIELTMSIHAKKKYLASQNRKFGAIDEKFMKRAEELLFGELSAALEIPYADVRKFISDRLVKK